MLEMTEFVRDVSNKRDISIPKELSNRFPAGRHYRVFYDEETKSIAYVPNNKDIIDRFRHPSHEVNRKNYYVYDYQGNICAVFKASPLVEKFINWCFVNDFFNEEYTFSDELRDADVEIF